MFFTLQKQGCGLWREKKSKANSLFPSGYSDTMENINFLDNSQVFHKMFPENPVPLR